MKNKVAEAVCIATQKTNHNCEKIKHTCKKPGSCAYCLVMAEELIANGITLTDHPTEKGDGGVIELIDLCGIHKLSGVEAGEDSIRFILDGVAYEAIEDPADGYRSYMGKLNITDKRIQFTFPPVEVLCSMNNDEEILEIRDTNNGETILRVGTDYSDSYYPYCVFNWRPEKMACNGYAKRR